MERTPNRTHAMRAAGEYWIRICRTCSHPGGAHIIDNGCACGECPGYDEADGWGMWSDRQSRELREAAAAAGRPAPGN